MEQIEGTIKQDDINFIVYRSLEETAYIMQLVRNMNAALKYQLEAEKVLSND